MDSRILVLLAAVFVASGCAHGSAGLPSIPGGSAPTPPSTGPSVGSGKGLVVQKFTVSDNSLTASQEGTVTLKLKNFHDEELTIREASLFNLGPDLSISGDGRSCTPPLNELGSMKQGIAPVTECTWVLQVSEDLDGFNSKTVPIKLNLKYNTSFSPNKPLKIHFRKLEDIEDTRSIKKSYSNGEVRMILSSENPIPYSQNGTLTITAKEAGRGRIEGKSFNFSYSPSSLFFDNCPDSEEFVIGNKVQFSCDIKLDSGYDSQTTRHLIVSTSYKYVKQPSLDIRVVNE